MAVEVGSWIIDYFSFLHFHFEVWGADRTKVKMMENRKQLAVGFFVRHNDVPGYLLVRHSLTPQYHYPTCEPGTLTILVHYGPDFECLKSQLCIMRLRSFQVIIDVSTVFSYDASWGGKLLGSSPNLPGLLKSTHPHTQLHTHPPMHVSAV